MTETLPRSARAILRDRLRDRLRVVLPAITLANGRPLVEADAIRLSSAWPDETDRLVAVHIHDGGALRTGDWTSGPPRFQTTVTLELRIVIQAAAGEDAIREVADLLEHTIDLAILLDSTFMADIEDVPTMFASQEFQQGGDRTIGNLAMRIELRTEEWFEPDLDNNPLSTAALRIDLTDPADLLGTYTPDDGFPEAAAAPRESGPDGRYEIGADIVFPNT